MPQLIISTVGTSILTNQIDLEIDADNTLSRLQKAANYSCDDVEQYYPDVKDILDTLEERAKEKLADSSDLEEIRKASAELNGIYGFYNNQLGKGTQDTHWLITTDTAQSKIAVNLIKNFLAEQGINNVQVFDPQGFSTASTESFQNGIDETLKEIDETLDGYKKDNSYKICFNLVGGFKALQGYFNTIGMFYADEIIYIFEENSELIKIPRLPIQIDHSVIKPVKFALMATQVDISIKLSELEGVPETLLFKVEDEAILSNWGRLTWNKCKRDFFTQDKLLKFPKLSYEKSFHEDYRKNATDDQKKQDLHEVIAEVSASMIKYNGNTTRFDRRLNFSRYQGAQKCEGGVKKNQLDHFYIKNTGRRVSCLVKDGNLYLRHYGEHDYVNDNP